MSFHIGNWHHSCSEFFQNWFKFSIYWILYLSIILLGAQAHLNSMAWKWFSIWRVLKPTFYFGTKWKNICRHIFEIIIRISYMIDIEITHYPIKIVTYPFGIGHIGHEGMCWNIKVFFVCFDPTSLCHMLHPSPLISPFPQIYDRISLIVRLFFHTLSNLGFMGTRKNKECKT